MPPKRKYATPPAEAKGPDYKLRWSPNNAGASPVGLAELCAHTLRGELQRRLEALSPLPAGFNIEIRVYLGASDAT